jgi:DNA adenine methylase
VDLNFLRYPGSKRRLLHFLKEHLPSNEQIPGRFIEPFVGSGVIYFYLQPRRAILSDLNKELIQIYSGITRSPDRVWRIYKSFPSTKAAYRKIRSLDPDRLSDYQQAARSLYLNRTCFKGMWRQNLRGRFNVGYGGQSRRWAISRRTLFRIGTLLRSASIQCCDFEQTISTAKCGDFIFLDPPYRPGEKEQVHSHYGCKQFLYADQERLASSLNDAQKAGIQWTMTNSAHPSIRRLYKGFKQIMLPAVSGRSLGQVTDRPGDVLISNW